ncbi:MAG: hypothetical protein ACFFCW_36205 [Candidatus Hodarchaeota archaeon]
MQKISLYFKSEVELSLYREIKTFAENQGLSLSGAVLALLESLKVRDQYIKALHEQVADAKAQAEMYAMLFDISDPDSREVAKRAMEHFRKTKKIERTEGLESALKYHKEHKGKKK